MTSLLHSLFALVIAITLPKVEKVCPAQVSEEGYQGFKSSNRSLTYHKHEEKYRSANLSPDGVPTDELARELHSLNYGYLVMCLNC